MVNGRALVNGLQLASMDASDMLDVIHYFFEDDINMSSGEQAEARDKTRTMLYREFYKRPYAHATGVSAQQKRTTTAGANSYEFDTSDDDDEIDEPINPFSPSKRDTKPYVPPTNFNANAAKPFGEVLDAPLG